MSAKTRHIKQWASSLLSVCNHNQDHALQEVKWLLLHAKEQAGQLGGTSADSNRFSEINDFSDFEINLMHGYVEQRVQRRKPLQYILGTQPFMDLDVIVRPPTLIPRWETEEWTSRLAKVLRTSLLDGFNSNGGTSNSARKSRTECRPRPFNILDLCTGSGCIPLGLASALPLSSSSLFGVDIDPRAVQLALENEVRNRSLLNENSVHFLQADLFDSQAINTFFTLLGMPSDPQVAQTRDSKLQQSAYDLVISNPPYIAHSEHHELEPEVSQWEDPKALMADEEGLVFYPRIAQLASEILGARTRRNGPILDRVMIPELVLEIGGDHQAMSVSDAVRQAGFTRVEIWKDLAGKARCVVGAR